MNASNLISICCKSYRFSPQAHYKYAKYLDSVLESRINVVASQNGGSSDNESSRASIIKEEKACHKYIFAAMKEYIEALKLGQKHVFQALPRMLTLWFDFTAILDGDDEMGAIQDEANAFVVKHMKAIPAISFYSVLPQLISRIGHKDEEASIPKEAAQPIVVYLIDTGNEAATFKIG